MILLALALAAAAHPHPPVPRAPSLPQQEEGKAAKPTKGGGDRIDAVARRYALAGELLVAKGKRIVLHRAYGTIDPAGGAPHRAGERWRLASVTKQVTAALILAAVAADPEIGSPARDVFDRVAPDARIGRSAALKDWLDSIYPYPVLLDANLGALTMRHLLTHHTGLANPDDTPKTGAGVPRAYTAPGPDRSYCTSVAARPGAPFRYNNCDYIIAGEVLRYGAQTESGHLPPPTNWPKGMAMALRGEKGVPGFVGGTAEPSFELASWGAAGGLVGTARSVFDFDRALMTADGIPAFARDELWQPEGNGSYQALGAWVFPGRLAGCAAPKRIVQRDGEIWGVQVRNFILPDDDTVVIVFTNRSADDFAIGEVWQGKGFAFDLLSAAAC